MPAVALKLKLAMLLVVTVTGPIVGRPEETTTGSPTVVAETLVSTSIRLVNRWGQRLTEMAVRLMEKPESLVQFVPDRPGHDRRYSLDCSKIRREWNWSSEVGFSAGLAATIEWYRKHEDWIREVSALPVTRQVEAVRATLQGRNPEFDGVIRHRIENGVVVQVPPFVTDGEEIIVDPSENRYIERAK